MAEQLNTERVRTATRGILSRFYTKGNAYHHMRCLRMNINMAIFHRVKGKMMEAISIPKKNTDVMRISRARTETLKELNVLVPSSLMWTLVVVGKVQAAINNPFKNQEY